MSSSWPEGFPPWSFHPHRGRFHSASARRGSPSLRPHSTPFHRVRPCPRGRQTSPTVAASVTRNHPPIVCPAHRVIFLPGSPRRALCPARATDLLSRVDETARDNGRLVARRK